MSPCAFGKGQHAGIHGTFMQVSVNSQTFYDILKSLHRLRTSGCSELIYTTAISTGGKHRSSHFKLGRRTWRG